jgi:hypothetical protein
MPTLDSIRRLTEAPGPDARTLDLGSWSLRVEGLDDTLASSLDHRWGGFVRREAPDRPRVRIRLLRGREDLFLGRWQPGEQYRVEATVEDGLPVVRSYGFAACPGTENGCWIVAVAREGEERLDRVVDNAVRCIVSRLAVQDGGFTLHAAAVLRDGLAYVFAGPSNSGKSTAVALSVPAVNLGDDMVVLFPGAEGWLVPATPFDNAEVGPTDPPLGLHPVKGIWRLYKSEEHRLEDPPVVARVASLLGCVAMLNAMPDVADAALENVRSFLSAESFGHLWFRRDPGFWSLIE